MGRRNKSRNGHITQHYHFTEPAAPPPMDWKNPKISNNGRRERREETNQSDEINI
jgi:hypothetical protein